MRKTGQYAINNNTITVDANRLAQMLSCGRGTAVKIGTLQVPKLK